LVPPELPQRRRLQHAIIRVETDAAKNFKEHLGKPACVAAQIAADGAMATEESNNRKRVSVNAIKPGMFVVSLDQSWLRTPFFFHRRLIKSAEEVERLRSEGVREVVIDTALGMDVDREPPPAAEAVDAPADDRRPQTAPMQARSARTLSAAELAFRPLVQELHTAQTIHEEALAAAQSIFDGTRGGAPVKFEVAEKIVTDLVGSISRSPEASLLLMQMRRFQRDLFTHAVNVCVLSLVVSTLENLEADATEFGMGALLHDIGETRIPRNLVKNREEFTEPERRLMEQHPKLGALLLEQSGSMPALTRRIVLEHHERADGSGFPRGCASAEMSFLSQIVAVTDTYDYLLSGRGQTVLQPNEVLRQLFMQSNAGAFDRGLVERIIRCLGVYPIGSLVELNTGERAIVVAANRSDALRPTVRIITSYTGAIQSHGPLVSLVDAVGSAPERRIIGALDPGRERLDPMAFMKWSAAAAG
jgi:HD-GYP domain-containing protein (c-di-GMP phosphodiesterase class II)